MASLSVVHRQLLHIYSISWSIVMVCWAVENGEDNRLDDLQQSCRSTSLWATEHVLVWIPVFWVGIPDLIVIFKRTCALKTLFLLFQVQCWAHSKCLVNRGWLIWLAELPWNSLVRKEMSNWGIPMAVLFLRDLLILVNVFSTIVIHDFFNCPSFSSSVNRKWWPSVWLYWNG